VLWFDDDGRLEGRGLPSYALALFTSYTASYLYNHFPQGNNWLSGGVLRRVDHAAIYVHIAGTTAAFLIETAADVGTGLVRSRAWWMLAFAGVALKLCPGDPRRLTLVVPGHVLYLGMGVGGGIACDLDCLEYGRPMLMAGGAIVLVGFIFFACRWIPYHTALWHAAVLVSGCLFYAAIALDVMRMRLGEVVADFAASGAAALLCLRCVTFRESGHHSGDDVVRARLWGHAWTI
jgi:hemolysin III